ncbi:MAG: biotin transporter BioY, partial [Pseudomonadota bacterium]|nr:biotin transporter BioY [Pseudomonadota bacterium]
MVGLNPVIKTSNSTLIATIVPRVTIYWPYNIVFAILASSLLVLSAKVQVPFYPVPMTMQTFAVLMVSMVCGSRLGALTVLIYLIEGLFGLPVFAGTPQKGIGISYMLGPTGGYLVGFFISSIVVGYLADNGFGRNFLTSLIS